MSLSSTWNGNPSSLKSSIISGKEVFARGGRKTYDDALMLM
jgi:hypothetical protein